MRREIIFFSLVITTVSGGMMEILYSKQEDFLDRLKRDTRDLFKMCFTNNSNPVVISKDLLSNDWGRGENPLIVIDHNFNKQITGFLQSYPTYVLSFDSIDNLEPIIDNLERSTFWNIRSRFLIVGTRSRCHSINEILKLMWDRDMLSVYYLCNEKNSTMILTLNPYASYAPAPWSLMIKFGDNDELSLFGISYEKDADICKSITFDKTDELNATTIKIGYYFETKSSSKKENSIREKKYLKWALKSQVMNPFQILTLIGATPSLRKMDNFLGQKQDNNKKQSIDKRYDVYSVLLPIEYYVPEVTDVISDYTNECTFSILTRKTDSLPGISDITDNVQFILGTIVLLIMFTIVMVIISRDDIGLALMDMMKLVSGMTLETPLNRLAIKFIFFFGFLFSFLIVPDFLGYLSATLTKPPGRNIDTLKDLYENKLDVYHSIVVDNDIMNEQLWVTEKDKKYLHLIPPRSIMEDCVMAAQQNSSKACIIFTEQYWDLFQEHTDLYVSKETYFHKQLVFTARKNWPLKSKLDKMTINAIENGFNLRNFIEQRTFNRVAKKLTMERRIAKNEEYDELDFDNLIFNYYLFGYFVAFGIMVFGIEIILARYFRIYRQFLMLAHY